jgi:signal transduction histidine kinase/putative methionine-R-sulfoxide reductase with GAF domain
MLASLQHLFSPLPSAAMTPVQQPVHLILLIGMSLATGYLAYQLWRQHGVGVGRKLAWLAGAQALAAACRFSEWLLRVDAWPALVACHAVVDLAILGLFLYGLRRLLQEGSLGRPGMSIVTAAATGAVFWGLMGSQMGQPLLAGNWIAIFFHVLFLGIVAALLLRLLIRRWVFRADLLQVEAKQLGLSYAQVQTELTAVQEDLLEKTRLHAELKEEVTGLRQKSRVLEKILSVTARMGMTRNLPDLLDQVVRAVRDHLGFRMVLLRLYSPSTRAFEARAFAGIPEEGKALLAGVQVSWEDYRKLTQPRFRVSDSYFLDHLVEGAVEATEGGYVPDLGPRAQGEWHEDDALIIPLIAPDGETKGYLSVDDPVDRRVPSLSVIRQLEYLARQAATAIDSVEVYDRLAKKNSELAIASDMVNNLSEMKSNFIANVSHELRTPLTSITAYAEILQHESEPMNEDVRKEFLRVIHKESAKLSAIIDDILDLSRMQDGQAQLERHQTDLAALARRLEGAVRKKAQEKGITFHLDLAAESLPLHADPVLLQQLLDHLLSNALKFTPQGGAVRLALTDDGGKVGVVVEDSGIGIPEQKMRYIFDRFYQADGSATREHGGQGVGLAICQDIVRYHDGRIWAENRVEGGARFQVVLPRRLPVMQKADARMRAWNPKDSTGFVERLIHWVSETLETDIVSLMVPDDDRDYLVIRAAVGLPASVVHSTRVRKGDGIAGKVWASGRTLHLADVTADERMAKPENHPRYTTPSVLSVPLLDGLDVVGVVNVNNRRDGRPLDDRDRLLLEALAPRLSYLLGQFRNHEQQGQRFTDLQEALRTAMTLRHQRYDPLTAVCQEICLAAARRIKLPQAELEHLAFALQTYDVGFSRVSPQLLTKQESLTPEESLQIQQHVAAGLDILDPLQVSSKVRQIILHHHERFDGRGYPEGLEGEAIPIGARLLALTDSLNAMLRDRPHRPRRSAAAASAEIERLAGAQFCPRLAEPFLAEIRARAARLTELQEDGYGREPAAPGEMVPVGCGADCDRDHS